MPSKKNKRNNSKNNNRRKNYSSLKPYPNMMLYSSPRAVMPPEFDTVLSYHVQDQVTNVGALLASIKFDTNAYDVDPALGSTAMPGFTEFAGFYSRFRTLAMSYKFSVANQEVFPLTIIHGFSNSSIASGAVNINYAGNPMMQSTMVGPLTGMCTRILRGSKTVCQINGTQQPLFDDLFTGSTTSSTLTSTGTKYCYCAVVAPVVLTAAGGLLVTVEIKLRVRFYLPFWLTG